MRKKKHIFTRFFIFTVMPAILILTCAPAARAQVAGSGKKQQPAPGKNLADTWIGALNRHDTAALVLLYADSARIISPNWEGVRTGREAVKDVYGRYFAGTPDLEHLLTHLITTDTALVIEYISRGTFLHPEPGTPDYMKGKKYELQNCTRLTIRKGKILMQVNYFDQVAFLRQVGFFDQH